jgi:hypothetical protein
MPRKTKKLVTAKGGVWQKLLDVLYENYGKIVDNATLINVSGQHNYARRIRELRAEGWDIVYSASPSGYILNSTKKVTFSADKYINLKLRQKILERDRYTCQLCGNTTLDQHEYGTKVKLEVDHIIPLKQGGRTIEENLWTLCSRCNAGKKSLLAYPETVKNRIISINLPDDLRQELSGLALKRGETVNNLILQALRFGIKKLK